MVIRHPSKVGKLVPSCCMYATGRYVTVIVGMDGFLQWELQLLLFGLSVLFPVVRLFAAMSSLDRFNHQVDLSSPNMSRIQVRNEDVFLPSRSHLPMMHLSYQEEPGEWRRANRTFLGLGRWVLGGITKRRILGARCR